MLLAAYRRRVLLVDIVQSVAGFLERVVQRYEVADRIVVIGDEQPPEQGLGARRELLMLGRDQVDRSSRLSPLRAWQWRAGQGGRLVRLVLRGESTRPLGAPTADAWARRLLRRKCALIAVGRSDLGAL